MIKQKYTLKDFRPLIAIFSTILLVSGFFFFKEDGGIEIAMRIFMAGFFLVFGFLKAIKLNSFAEAYQMYDLLAKRSLVYAYAYPFIELGLGFFYLFDTAPIVTNWITLLVMLFSGLGVYLKLRKKEQIMCACLGTVFKVPMTWVTLFEDLLMATMALIMLFAL